MSFSFPIPDWSDEVFNYPGESITGEADVKKKPKSGKRKHDVDGSCEKGQLGNSEAPQQAFKKKKTGKIASVPEKKNIKDTKGPTTNEPKIKKKKQRKTKAIGISLHQEENQTIASELQTEADNKSLPRKRKKKRKNNNKYKGLNIRQNKDRMAQADSARERNESKQQEVMKIQKSKEGFPANTSKEETQASQAEEFKKKKKDKSKLLEHTHNSVLQEDSASSQKNSTDTPHQNTIQDMKVVNSHGNKMDSHHSLATSVGPDKKKKKKKTINRNSDTILSNGKETQPCLENGGHENACSEERNKVKNKKVKSEKSGEGNIGRKNAIGSSVPIYKNGEVRAEDGTKKKKKKKENVRENGNLLKVKDIASNSKKAKLKKQQLGENCSKKVKQSEEEELVFDSDEECSEEFKKDLGALLSSLNFTHFKTQGSGKEIRDDDDDDDTNLDVNNRQEMSQTKKNEDSTKQGSEGEGRKRKGLTEKRKKMESAKTSHKKINGEQKSSPSQGPTASVKKGAKFNREKLAKLLEKAASIQKEKPSPPASSADSLKERMEGRLMAARFRMVNQELYTKSSTEARQLFKRDPAAFNIYHQGYQAQVCQWPANPLDIIIKWLSKKPKEWVVADMGCGEATLAQHVPQSCVHSLDLVAANPQVTACDMAHTPLAAASVDVVVFCLSLMGTNLKDFMMEANRVLREGGIMKIAEVESRFEDVKEFEKHLAKYGFHCTARDVSHKYFFLLEFKKNRKLKKTATFPDIFLKPCLYKKR